MPDPTTDDSADSSSTPLYAWWLDLIPTMLDASAASSGLADAQWAGVRDAPMPIGPIAQALASTQRVLGGLYTDMLSALAASPQGDALDAFRRLVQGRLDALQGLYALAGQAFSTQHDLTSIAARWTQAPAMLFADALGPVSANLERAYGGLADAFGLAPARELREAAGAMATASLARRQAQAEYLALVGGALAAGAERLTERLGEMAQRGESVDSLLGLLRLWARATDEAMHQAMQDPKALEASAKLVRATTNARQQQQRVVAIVSHAINVPTRSEVDDAYREIQELKRELRRLRKRVEPTLAEPAADGAVSDSAPKARPSRAAGRSGGRPARGTNKKAVTA